MPYGFAPIVESLQEGERWRIMSIDVLIVGLTLK